MRRTLIMTVASTFVLAAAPGAAMARHHHKPKHHRGHHHARIERFGKSWSADNGSGSTSPAEDNAGTVASFSGGVLTIKLNDGSTVSGQVNNDTELECRAAQSPEMARDDGGPGDDNSGDGDHNAGSGDNQAGENENNEAGENENNEAGENEANEAGENENNEAGNENEGNEMENENGQACDSSALTPGTVVREAELRLSGGGASWKKVELER